MPTLRKSAILLVLFSIGGTAYVHHQEVERAQVERKRQEEIARAEVERKRQEEIARAEVERKEIARARVERKRQEEIARAEVERKRQEEIARAEQEWVREQEFARAEVERNRQQSYWSSFKENASDMAPKLFELGVQMVIQSVTGKTMPEARPKTQNVRGYTRQNETYVKPYTRSAPTYK